MYQGQTMTTSRRETPRSQQAGPSLALLSSSCQSPKLQRHSTWTDTRLNLPTNPHHQPLPAPGHLPTALGHIPTSPGHLPTALGRSLTTLQQELECLHLQVFYLLLLQWTHECRLPQTSNLFPAVLMDLTTTPTPTQIPSGHLSHNNSWRLPSST